MRIFFSYHGFYFFSPLVVPQHPNLSDLKNHAVEIVSILNSPPTQVFLSSFILSCTCVFLLRSVAIVKLDIITDLELSAEQFSLLLWEMGKKKSSKFQRICVVSVCSLYSMELL